MHIDRRVSPAGIIYITVFERRISLRQHREYRAVPVAALKQEMAVMPADPVVSYHTRSRVAAPGKIGISREPERQILQDRLFIPRICDLYLKPEHFAGKSPCFRSGNVIACKAFLPFQHFSCRYFHLGLCPAAVDQEAPASGERELKYS